MKKLFLTIGLVLALSVGFVHAATGVIDPANDGSWKAVVQNPDLGAATTINFGKFTTQAAKNITVSDTELRGFAWGEGVGWIVTNCLDTTSGCSSSNGNFKVANDGTGNLSGYAWGENTGWINFGPFTNPAISTVKITGGEFGGTLGAAGYAWSQNFGYIMFDCSSPASCVKTDWAPSSTPTYQCNDGLDNDGDGDIDYPADSGCSSSTDNSEQTPGGGGGSVPACNDSRDNDNDGYVDYPNDPGCWGLADPDETDITTPPPDTCATNPSLCVPPPDICVTNPSICTPPPTPTCSTDPALCPPAPTCQTNPSLCTPPPDTCATNPSLCVPGPTFCQQYPNDPSCTTPITPPPSTGCAQNPAGCVPPPGHTIPEVIGDDAVAAVTGYWGKGISFVGLAAIPIAATVSYLLVNPFSLYDIGLLLARLWSLILVFFGLKKKSNPWGTVYDSVTKQPIDPAYVVLYDMTGKEVATSITDIEGRYGFAVPAGTYTLSANKTNFEFPSKKLAGKTEDELYRDLYFGGPITVTEEGGIIAKNIPMDQLNFDWNEYAKDQQHRLRHFKRQDVLVARISNVLFIIGFIVTGVAVAVSPNLLNISLLALYIIMAIARIVGLQIHPKGSVRDFATNAVLPFSIVRVYSNATNQEILKRVADQRGKYYALIANGDYRVTVDRKNPDASYTSNYIPDPIAVRRGYLKEDFKL